MPARGLQHLASLCRALGLDEEGLAEVDRRLDNAFALAAEERERCAVMGAKLLTLFDAGYPAPLHRLDQPPPVLSVRGEIPDHPAVAVVGSRRADPYGLETAERFARGLAARGLTIVSGFAIGIDAAAHRGALAAPGGRTLALLGCGLDVNYPRGRRTLARRIAEAGAVVSEFPLGYPPMAANFPVRNRLIAALSLGVLVVRATLRSGSLITARLALELGRDVYAVPARLRDPLAEGTLRLLQDGALLAREPRDVVESLPHYVRARLPADEDPSETSPPPPEGEARRVWKALPPDRSATCEDLARASELSTERVLSLLLELELGGWARRYPGPRFARIG